MVPLAYYRGADDMPEGPEYELARRFADELGVKLKITPLRSYAEIYAALDFRACAFGGGGIEGACCSKYPASSSARHISVCANI